MHEERDSECQGDTAGNAPSPGVAMLLGFIPGVGAMYNGQFVKGFVHVIIFVMLIIGACDSDVRERAWHDRHLLPRMLTS